METTKRIPTSVRFSDSVYSRIQDAAKREHRSVSNWIEFAVLSYLESEPNETTIAAISKNQIF